MENLISMTDFVLEQEITIEVQSLTDQWELRSSKFHRILAYAKFLKQPLQVSMFLPCDYKGNILQEKSIFNTTDEDYIFDSESFNKYNQAKQRCLFNGVTEDYVYFIIKTYKNIEGLLDVTFDLTLTDTAKKMLF
jgi:hypothetical protein